MKTSNSPTTVTFTLIVVGMMVAPMLPGAQSAKADLIWTPKADMPTARMAFCTNVVDGKIYAISALQGGTNRLTKVEAYDPATDTWTEKADMPTTRAFLATSVVNGKIYAIGGSTSWGGTELATVEVYDPMSDTWTRKADMPTARDTETSVVNGIIYAIGGYRNGAAISTVEAYDPVTDTWTKKADMPTARTLHATQSVDGKIYVMGGQTMSTFDAFAIVEVYDPETDTWTRKGDMPVPRIFPTSTSVLDNKIYCFGGRATRGGAPLSQVFEYDTVTDTWTEIGRLPVNNGGMGVSTVGRRIYIMGGSSATYPFSSVLSTVWEFIPAPEFDFNEDGVVDAKDASMLVNHWHTDESRFDLAPSPAGDGIVDVQDLVLLSEHLFEDYSGVAHWMLDETEGLTAYDSFGDNDAYVAGDPVWLPDGGQVGGAIQLDGVDDYIGTPFVLNPGAGSFSVFAWVQGGGPGQVVVSQFGGKDWLLIDAAVALMTDLRGNSRVARSLASQAVITDGDWHHVGLTWDGTTRRLYVNDVMVAEDEPLLMPDVTEGLNLGCGANLDSGSFFSGLIDDVRVYNRAVRP